MNRCSPLHGRRGYILLLTLVLLAVVAAGLAAVARRSHHASIEATRFERQAQRKWLVASAEALVPEIDDLLLAHAEDALLAAGVLAFDFDLGHHRLRLTLGDEQAKANLNTLWNRQDRAVFRTTLQGLAAPHGWDQLLTPRSVGSFEAAAAGSSLEWPSFVSFEQLLGVDAVHRYFRGAVLPPTSAVPGGQETPCLLDEITLWGDGQLRWERAKHAATKAMLTPLLSPSQVSVLRLVSAEPPRIPANPAPPQSLKKLPGGESGGNMWGALNLTDHQREQLAARTTQESRCFSVRLQMDDGRRVHTALTIADSTNEDSATQLIRFTW